MAHNITCCPCKVLYMKYVFLALLALIMAGCSSHTPMKVHFSTSDPSAVVYIEEDEINGPATEVYRLKTEKTKSIAITIRGKKYVGSLEIRRHAHISRGNVVVIPLPAAERGSPFVVVVMQRIKDQNPKRAGISVSQIQGIDRNKLLETAAKQGQIIAILDLEAE